MVKRIVAAYLWVCACYSFGAVFEEAVGLSRYAGLLVGVGVAAAVFLMPHEVWNRRLQLRFTRANEPGPLHAPLAQPR